MTQKLLLVNASPRGEASESLRIAEAVVAAAAGATVDRLDLFDETPPAFGAAAARAKLAVIAGTEPDAEAAAAWESVLAWAARFAAADAYVFAVPMWTGGVPWALKLLVDTVTQPGVAFGFDPATGYEGLLPGRRAVTVYTSQVYTPGASRAFGTDHHSTYMEDWLRFLGIDAIDVIRLQTTFPGRPDLAAARDAALEAAAAAGRGLVAAPVAT